MKKKSNSPFSCSNSDTQPLPPLYLDAGSRTKGSEPLISEKFFSSCSQKKGRQAGFALLMSLLVLTAILIIALPFSYSTSKQREQVSYSEKELMKLYAEQAAKALGEGLINNRMSPAASHLQRNTFVAGEADIPLKANLNLNLLVGGTKLEIFDDENFIRRLALNYCSAINYSVAAERSGHDTPDISDEGLYLMGSEIFYHDGVGLIRACMGTTMFHPKINTKIYTLYSAPEVAIADGVPVLGLASHPLILGEEIMVNGYPLGNRGRGHTIAQYHPETPTTTTTNPASVMQSMFFPSLANPRAVAYARMGHEWMLITDVDFSTNPIEVNVIRDVSDFDYDPATNTGFDYPAGTSAEFYFFDALEIFGRPRSDVNLNIQIEDEQGKINLNAAPYEVVRNASSFINLNPWAGVFKASTLGVRTSLKDLGTQGADINYTDDEGKPATTVAAENWEVVVNGRAAGTEIEEERLSKFLGQGLNPYLNYTRLEDALSSGIPNYQQNSESAPISPSKAVSLLSDSFSVTAYPRLPNWLAGVPLAKRKADVAPEKITDEWTPLCKAFVSKNDTFLLALHNVLGAGSPFASMPEVYPVLRTYDNYYSYERTGDAGIARYEGISFFVNKVNYEFPSPITDLNVQNGVANLHPRQNGVLNINSANKRTLQIYLSSLIENELVGSADARSVSRYVDNINLLADKIIEARTSGGAFFNMAHLEQQLAGLATPYNINTDLCEATAPTNDENEKNEFRALMFKLRGDGHSFAGQAYWNEYLVPGKSTTLGNTASNPPVPEYISGKYAIGANDYCLPGSLQATVAGASTGFDPETGEAIHILQPAGADEVAQPLRSSGSAGFAYGPGGAWTLKYNISVFNRPKLTLATGADKWQSEVLNPANYRSFYNVAVKEVLSLTGSISGIPWRTGLSNQYGASAGRVRLSAENNFMGAGTGVGVSNKFYYGAGGNTVNTNYSSIAHLPFRFWAKPLSDEPWDLYEYTKNGLTLRTVGAACPANRTDNLVRMGLGICPDAPHAISLGIAQHYGAVGVGERNLHASHYAFGAVSSGEQYVLPNGEIVMGLGDSNGNFRAGNATIEGNAMPNGNTLYHVPAGMPIYRNASNLVLSAAYGGAGAKPNLVDESSLPPYNGMLLIGRELIFYEDLGVGVTYTTQAGSPTSAADYPVGTPVYLLSHDLEINVGTPVFGKLVAGVNIDEPTFWAAVPLEMRKRDGYLWIEGGGVTEHFSYSPDNPAAPTKFIAAGLGLVHDYSLDTDVKIHLMMPQGYIAQSVANDVLPVGATNDYVQERVEYNTEPALFPTEGTMVVTDGFKTAFVPYYKAQSGRIALLPSFYNATPGGGLKDLAGIASGVGLGDSMFFFAPLPFRYMDVPKPVVEDPLVGGGAKWAAGEAICVGYYETSLQKEGALWTDIALKAVIPTDSALRLSYSFTQPPHWKDTTVNLPDATTTIGSCAQGWDGGVVIEGTALTNNSYHLDLAADIKTSDVLYVKIEFILKLTATNSQSPFVNGMPQVFSIEGGYYANDNTFSRSAL